MTELEQRIDYREVAELDLESIEHVSDSDLPAFFKDVADRATAGQLAQFLELVTSSFMADEDEAAVKEELARIYVERRTRVVRDMRSSMNVSLGALDEIDRADRGQ